MKVEELMNKSVVSIAPSEPVALAARLLSRHNVGSLPVCAADGRLRGIVTDRDIVLRCIAAESDPERTPVSEIMTRLPVSAAADDDIRQAVNTMALHQIRRLPVLRDGRLVGMLSLGDVARSRACAMEASHALSEISLNVRRR